MTGITQLLLAVVICVLTFLLSFAAIQTFYLLHDLRQAAKKLNRILDKPDDIALRQILQIPQKFSAPVKDDRVISAFPEEISPPASPSSRSSRFFHKSGSPLRS
jgi:hypothetical protein